ncbi:MAG: rhodanese-like domain-containing protein [Chitinophagaceae bacterium]|nr:rhodanese-like domain-containing protein [Chitinophagaceae bacterium]
MQENGLSLEEALKKEVFLVDVRTPMEFMMGTAEGAVNIPLDELPYRFEEFEGKENIVVFCRSGARSEHAKALLNHQGFENVTNGINTERIKLARNGK